MHGDSQRAEYPTACVHGESQRAENPNACMHEESQRTETTEISALLYISRKLCI